MPRARSAEGRHFGLQAGVMMRMGRWILAAVIATAAGTASAQQYCYSPEGYYCPFEYCTGAGPCGPRGLEWAVPQGFAGADFRPACAVHDRCYSIPGVSRRYCDRQFHRGLLDSCRNSRRPILCRLTAHTMFGITRLFGGPTFRASQAGWYR
jgi:hypothetical protein